MRERRMDETKSREQYAKRSAGSTALKIAGVAVVALAATALITSLHDIRRYIQMVRM